MQTHSQLLFSAAALGGNAVGRTLDLWLLYFYLGSDQGDVPRRASAAAIAGVLVLVRLVEAFDDPIIGAISDRTRSRLGRRVPYVLLAAPFAALFFVLIWMPPFTGEQAGNAWYLLVVIWCYYLANTFMTGPFEALIPHIASSQRERMSISTWQVCLGVIGAALALTASGPLIDTIGFARMATLMAAIGLVGRYVGLAGVWQVAIRDSRPDHPQTDASETTLATIIGCLRNRHFLAFLPSAILYQLAVQLITGVLPFLVGAVLLRSDTGSAVSMLTGTAILALVLALPLVLAAVRVRGKRTVYGWGMMLAAIYFPLLALVGLVPGIPPLWQAIIYAAPMGIAFAPSQVIPPAIVADICDDDRRTSGHGREATFYATQHTLEKTVGAFAPAILALVLSFGSTPDEALGVRLVGPVAGALAAVGYVTFQRYRLADPS